METWKILDKMKEVVDAVTIGKANISYLSEGIRDRKIQKIYCEKRNEPRRRRQATRSKQGLWNKRGKHQEKTIYIKQMNPKKIYL